ncbi:MAG: hypothetical protein K2N17_02860, partial [Clostridia bacterium]|nr:hypothetical protein [Clostridia bacterium]
TASANFFNFSGDSREEIAQSIDAGADAKQTLFTLKVFEELGLITHKGGKIQVIRGEKTQLTNSALYNYIDSLK